MEITPGPRRRFGHSTLHLPRPRPKTCETNTDATVHPPLPSNAQRLHSCTCIHTYALACSRLTRNAAPDYDGPTPRPPTGPKIKMSGSYVAYRLDVLLWLKWTPATCR